MLLGALSREPSSFHHVPELADLGDRLSRGLGSARTAGAGRRGRGARPERRGGVRPPAARRRPPRARRPRPRPGAAGWPEPAGGRGAPARGRRRAPRPRSRTSCSSRPGRPSTTSRTSTRRSASRAGPRPPAGPSPTASSGRRRRLTAGCPGGSGRDPKWVGLPMPRAASIRRMTSHARPTGRRDRRST